MNREYIKIKSQIEEVIPLESTIQKARQIENIQTLIKNKGNVFDISEEEFELARKLV